MYPTLVIRCNDETTVKEIMLLLQRELRIRDCFVQVATDEQIYYSMTDLASDISEVKMLTVNFPSDNDE